jgi:TonB family protein
MIAEAVPSVPTGAELVSDSASPDILTTVRDEQRDSLQAPEDRRLVIALAVALLIHLLPILPIVVAMGGFGGSPPSQEKQPIGDAAGTKEGVNVEIVDATEFDRRYVSFTAGKDAADREATTAKPRQSATPPPSDATPEPAEQPAPPPSPPSPPSQLSEADLNAILQDARQDIESVVGVTSKAAMANQGETSAFVRGVVRKLKQSMPSSRGIKGTVVIGVILTETGQIAWVGVLKKSANPDLDRTIVERVRATQLDNLGKEVSPKERKFQITYTYE